MPNAHIEETYRTIMDRLHCLRTQWRILLLSQGLLLWFGIVTLAFSIALVIDHVLPLPRTLRMGLLGSLVVLSAYAAIRCFIAHLFNRITISRVAAYVENAYPRFENRILSVVQLHPELEHNRFGYALEFIDKLVEQTRECIDQVKPSQVFEQEFLRIRKYTGLVACGIVLLVVVNAISPSAIGDLTQVFTKPPILPQEMLIVRIDEIRPGDTRIETDTDITISAKITGHLEAAVNLHYRYSVGQSTETNPRSKEKWNSILMAQSGTESTYRLTIRNVTQSLEYYIETKGTKSERYQIVASREPIVRQFRLKLNFPKYSQLSSKMLEENVGDLTALIGTKVQYNGIANKPLTNGNKLVFHQSVDLPLQTSDGMKLSGSFVVQRPEKYHIKLIDMDGMTNSEPIVYTINTIRDAKPEVEIVKPGRDMVLDDSMIVGLNIEGSDDYGLTTLQLIYQVGGDEGSLVTLPIRGYDPPRTIAYIDFPWDIDAIGLYPGDSVAYYVEAIDADNITGPNSGRSDTYTLRFPSLEELYATIESDQKGGQTGLESLFNQQAEATTIVKELLDKIRKRQSLTTKDEQLMQQVFEKQHQIEQTAEALVEDMQGTIEQINRNQLFDMKTVEKYHELQDLMNEALSKEHKELLRKLSEALEQKQLSEQDRKLAEANFNQEQFLQQLGRLKELYKQMILQQKLEATANKAKKLAERQTMLMKQLSELIERTDWSKKDGTTTVTPNRDNADEANPNDETGMESKGLYAKSDELAEQQHRVLVGMQALHETLEELEQEMSKQANLVRVAEEVKRLNQFARNEQISKHLRKSSSQIKHSHLPAAMQSGEKANNALGDLAQGLKNALEFMEGSNADDALTAIRTAVRSGVYLSKTHEGVMKSTIELVQSRRGPFIDGEIEQLQALTAKELSTAAGIDQLAAQLWELGKHQMQVDPKVVWILNEASDALKRAAIALEDRKPTLAVPLQEQCLAGLNQAVLQLLHAMNQMNQQMNMAGMQDMLEQLQQLAQNQGQLNETSQDLNQQMRRQGRTPALEQMLKKMGYEQQLIREATDRLAQMMEQFSEALGDLKEVTREMKEVERELEGGNLSQEVLDKQRRILTRMLESSTSLQKRNVGRKRKGKVAKTLTNPPRNNPIRDPKSMETMKQFDLNLRSGATESVPFQYREQVQRYFKTLSEQTQDTHASEK